MKSTKFKHTAAGLMLCLIILCGCEVPPVHAYSSDAATTEISAATEAGLAATSDEIGDATAGSPGLTPSGNLTLEDDIGTETTAGQQFITLVTKAGNTFYLVIDRDDKGNENVYFLNLVDEADLFSLLDEDAQSAYESAQSPETEEPTTTASTDSEPTTADEQSKEDEEATAADEDKTSGGSTPLLLLTLVIFGAIAGFLYFKIIKKKTDNSTATPPTPTQTTRTKPTSNICCRRKMMRPRMILIMIMKTSLTLTM